MGRFIAAISPRVSVHKENAFCQGNCSKLEHKEVGGVKVRKRIRFRFNCVRRPIFGMSCRDMRVLAESVLRVTQGAIHKGRTKAVHLRCAYGQY